MSPAEVVKVLPPESDLSAMTGAPAGTALELRAVYTSQPILVLACPGCAELMTVAEGGAAHFPARFAVVGPGRTLSVAGVVQHRCGLEFSIRAGRVTVMGGNRG